MSTVPGRRARGVVAVLVALVAGGSLFVVHRLGDGSASAQDVRRTGALVAAASPWPQAGHDARRSSAVAAGVSGPTSGRQRWQRRLGAAVGSGPVIGVDGSVLVGSDDGVLHALDPATGADRWSFDSGSPRGQVPSTSAAVLEDGTVLWPGGGEALYALDRRGRLLWRESLLGPGLSPAVAGDGRVYVSDAGGGVLALEVSEVDHRVVWREDLGGPSQTSATVSPTGTVVVGTSHALIGLRDDGDRARRRWRWPTPATLEVSAGVGPDGTAVVGLDDRYTYGVDDRGRQRWRFTKGDWSYSSATVTADGVAFAGDHLGLVDVLRADTGRVLRRTSTRPPASRLRTGKGIWTSVAVDARGRSYVGTAPGHVVGFAPGGALMFDVDVHAIVESYPALGADGTLYIGSQDGVLHAFADG